MGRLALRERGAAAAAARKTGRRKMWGNPQLRQGATTRRGENKNRPWQRVWCNETGCRRRIPHICCVLFLLLIKVGGWVYLALVLFLYSAAILAYRTWILPLLSEYVVQADRNRGSIIIPIIVIITIPGLRIRLFVRLSSSHSWNMHANAGIYLRSPHPLSRRRTITTVIIIIISVTVVVLPFPVHLLLFSHSMFEYPWHILERSAWMMMMIVQLKGVTKSLTIQLNVSTCVLMSYVLICKCTLDILMVIPTFDKGLPLVVKMYIFFIVIRSLE